MVAPVVASTNWLDPTSVSMSVEFRTETLLSPTTPARLKRSAARSRAKSVWIRRVWPLAVPIAVAQRAPAGIVWADPQVAELFSTGLTTYLYDALLPSASAA